MLFYVQRNFDQTLDFRNIDLSHFFDFEIADAGRYLLKARTDNGYIWLSGKFTYDVDRDHLLRGRIEEVSFQSRQEDEGYSVEQLNIDISRLIHVANTRSTRDDADYLKVLMKGSDFLIAGSANEVLRGFAGDDELFGGLGDNIILGGKGNDLLGAGFGVNILRGGAGDDYIGPSALVGHLYGGSGADTFLFPDEFMGGANTIHDFSQLEGDRLDTYGLADTFIGEDQFSGLGQIRVWHADGMTNVEISAILNNVGLIIDGDVYLKEKDFIIYA